METPLRHRACAASDLEIVHALYTDPAVSPFVGFEPCAREEFVAVLADLTRAAPLTIVERDGSPIGAYQVIRRARRLAHAAYLGSLAVAPGAHGRGLGGRILDDVIAQLRAEGLTRLELLVAADNRRAVALFVRKGFVVEGRLRRFFSRASTGLLHDELVMGMLLDEAPPASATPAPISVANAERYRWGGGCDGWHLVKSHGLSVIEERMSPGASEERHRHLLSRQFFRALSGELTLEVDGERVVLRQGEGLEVPPGAAHQAMNEGRVDARFLVISSPPSHGDRISAPR